MFRWLEGSVQRRRFFGGFSLPLLMGAGSGKEICFIFFVYIDRPSADKQVGDSAGQRLHCRLVLVHTVAIAHAVTVTHTVAPHVVTGTVSIGAGVCACGFTHFLFKALGHFIVQGAQLIV